ncbi:MAG: 16S rRNA (guanine(966)-N(2))-methyltransferase RsmD [Clostridia bacterium]|nr:16S rRNA (guanine(966)-N(2))-methyltransferase RsmD [Clostridia bacterium]
MRVNAGIYKDKLIECPKNAEVRPTTDKVKEAIFDILRDSIKDKIFIDLFAGSGSIGIEALSRGAQKVYFCDIDDKVIKNLKKNLSYVEDDKYEIVRSDYSSAIKKLYARGVRADIIFLDPPYGKDMNLDAVSEIYQKGLLRKHGILICEREVYDKPQREFYAYVDSRKYTNTCIDIYKNITKCALTGSFDPFTNGHEYVLKKALEQYDFAYIVILDNEEKKSAYSEDKKVRMIELALNEYKGKYRIDVSHDYAYKYCNDNGIDRIFRGVRNDKDLEYEEEMSKYNYENGKISTTYVQAINDISSSLVREKVLNGESVEGLVSDRILSVVKKIRRS